MPTNVNALLLSSGHIKKMLVKSVLTLIKQKCPVETMLPVYAILDSFGMSALKLVLSPVQMVLLVLFVLK